MKCKYCGAPVTLEEEFCPYCGALNEPARAHIAAMRQYQMDYQNTRSEVLDNAQKQSRRHAGWLIAGVLLVLNLVVFLCSMNTYELRDLWRSIQIHRHVSEYRTVLETAESSGEYEKLYDYYSRNYLYQEESLREFDEAVEMAGNYSRILNGLYYLNSEAATYLTQGDMLQRVANNTVSVYEALARKEKDYHPERFSGQHMEAMLDMQSRISALLKTYCGLSDEDIGKLPDMDSQSVMVLLGRRMGIYE